MPSINSKMFLAELEPRAVPDRVVDPRGQCLVAFRALDVALDQFKAPEPSRNGDTHRVEVEATDAAGFDEAKFRILSENARALEFDQAGFEEG